jgi:hypothetical protein
MDDIGLMMFEIGEEMNCSPSDYVKMFKTLTKWTEKCSLLAEGKITRFEFYDWVLTSTW